ncbi:MAG: M24 family metallopeptidase [Deltaproteobacteria bacterium]|nr:M24 family metallopeptidase [Deltaproteobacteria bacterium]
MIPQTHPSGKTSLLGDLQRAMEAHRLDYYLVPSGDEHGNEYPPPRNRRRQAVCGFQGSAGDFLAGKSRGYLFVDARYHLQALEQVNREQIVVHKVGQAGEPTLEEFLAGLPPVRVGFDPFLVSSGRMERLKAGPGVEWVAVEGNLVDQVWAERPPRSGRPLFALPPQLTGEAVEEKLTRVREAMASQGAAALVVTRLDDIAWLTNLRGEDIPNNPVFEAYLVVEEQQARCFAHDPLPPGSEVEGRVEFLPYEAFPADLRQTCQRLAKAERLLWLPADSASLGVKALAEGVPLVTVPGPVEGLKAVKNPVEREAARSAHLATGAAKARALARLFAALKKNERVTEEIFAGWLEAEYAQEAGYWGLSFPSIVAYGPHAAQVHYGTPDDTTPMAPQGMLLVDSGCQIAGATTDDTRTYSLGRPDPLQVFRHTLVLRGHVRLAMQVFPRGTGGAFLEALARAPLWEEGLDYGHGTGHGVGAFLNVHEGPQGFSGRSPAPLEDGMVISLEPGFYLAGWGGIRLENLYLVEEALGHPPHPAGKGWLRLSPLTLIPFDPTLTDFSRLMAEEKAWLAAYHHRVEEQIGPRLSGEALAWLKALCAPWQ